MSIDTTADTAPRRRGGFRDYLAIARLDHSTKHIFVVPGIAFAYMLRGVHTPHLALSIVLGFVAAIAIASANYVINEYLDRDFDRHHPTKSSRSAVQTELSGKIVLVEWIAFVAVGLIAAWIATPTMFWIALIFASQGVFYNVPPLRTKDKPYLDVISESINNPLRLAIGWAMIDPGSLPPSSVLFSYWFGGAFLMAAKRLSEYRQIVASHGFELLARYRASFLGYTELSLNLSCFLYAMLSIFFLAIFLIKYRIEYLLLFPIIITLFCYYLWLSMAPDSSAQKPEKLFREKKLMVLVALLGIGFVITTLYNLPFMTGFAEQQFILLK